MVSKCIICYSHYNKQRSASFHLFPKDEKTRELWQIACNVKNVTSSMKVCSRHFTTASFQSFGKDNYNILKKTAIPTLFLNTKEKYFHRLQIEQQATPATVTSTCSDTNVECETDDNSQLSVESTADCTTTEKSEAEYTSMDIEEMSSTTSISDEENSGTDDFTCKYRLELPCEDQLKTASFKESTVPVTFEENHSQSPIRSRKVWRPARIGDCTLEHFSTPEGAQRCFQLVVRKLSEYRKKLEAKDKQVKRLQKKMQTLRDVLSKLQRKKFISENAARVLLVLIR